MRILGLVLSIFVLVSCLNDKNSPLAYQPIVVDTTTAISEGMVSTDIDPNEIAGPSPAKVLARRADISAMVHVGSIARISRCDVCSIARVGYRSKSKMEES